MTPKSTRLTERPCLYAGEASVGVTVPVGAGRLTPMHAMPIFIPVKVFAGDLRRP